MAPIWTCSLPNSYAVRFGQTESALTTSASYRNACAEQTQIGDPRPDVLVTPPRLPPSTSASLTYSTGSGAANRSERPHTAEPADRAPTFWAHLTRPGRAISLAKR